MIRVAQPSLEEADVEAVVQVLRSGMLVQGAQVAEFEERVAAYVRVRHAVAVSSGTAALHLALLAAGIGAGDEVLVPGFTFPATANVITLVGATPVLIDIDLTTFNLSPDAIEPLVMPRTRAIMPVHLFGQSADMDAVMDAARRHGLTVIEDAACALGSAYRGRRCGSFPLAGCLSFHPRKVITTGEGGMVLTDDVDLADRVRALRDHGQRPGGQRGRFELAGFNYRLTDFQGALGVAQMSRLDVLLARRRHIVKLYHDALEGIPVVRPSVVANTEHSWQSYVVLVEEGVDRDVVASALRARDVESSIGTYALAVIPRFGKPDDTPRSVEAWRRSLSLPLHPGMSDEDVVRVAEALDEALRGARSPAR